MFFIKRKKENSQLYSLAYSSMVKFGVCGFFLPVKFATSLLASLAGGQVHDWLATGQGRKCEQQLNILLPDFF